MSLKNKALILLSLLLLASLVLAGCAKEKAPGEKTAGIELKLVAATYVPPAYKDFFDVLQEFVDYVNENGKGKVHLEFYHSGTLLKAEELIPGLMQGTADIVFQTDSYAMGTYPVLGILELPFLYKDAEDYSQKTRIGTPLYNLINKELAKQNLFMLAHMAATPEYLWTVKKPVKSLADFKGLRVRVAGRVEAQTVSVLGGSTTTVSSAELYEALQRGTVDGTVCYLGTIPARSLQEVVKYGTISNFGTYGEQIYFRLDKWQKLPPDVQNLFIEAGKKYEDSIKKALQYQDEKYWPAIKKSNIKLIKLTPEQEKQFKDTTLAVWEWWKKQLPPGVGEEAIKLATE